jgi:hypothetical protein
VTISQIPPEALQASDERVNVACNAKKTVTFEVIEKKAEEGLDAADETPATESGTPGSTPGEAAPGEDAPEAGESDQEIVAKPTVPAETPTNIVISPDRLPGN